MWKIKHVARKTLFQEHMRTQQRGRQHWDRDLYMTAWARGMMFKSLLWQFVSRQFHDSRQKSSTCIYRISFLRELEITQALVIITSDQGWTTRLLGRGQGIEGQSRARRCLSGRSEGDAWPNPSRGKLESGPLCRPEWWFSGCVMVCLLQVQRQTSRLLKSTLWFWMPIVLSLLIQSWVLRPMRHSGWDTVRLCCRWGLRFRLGWCGMCIGVV